MGGESLLPADKGWRRVGNGGPTMIAVSLTADEVIDTPRGNDQGAGRRGAGITRSPLPVTGNRARTRNWILARILRFRRTV